MLPPFDRSLRAVQNLLAAIGHDVRSDLSGILTSAHLLREGSSEDEERDEDFRAIFDGVEKIKLATRWTSLLGRAPTDTSGVCDLRQQLTGDRRLLSRVMGATVVLELDDGPSRVARNDVFVEYCLLALAIVLGDQSEPSGEPRVVLRGFADAAATGFVTLRFETQTSDAPTAAGTRTLRSQILNHLMDRLRDEGELSLDADAGRVSAVLRFPADGVSG